MDESGSENREAKHLPGKDRSGIALCLSGGGYRAAIFHMGALRRLNELGVLQKVDTISSVSGGSIVAGLLADRFARGVTGWEEGFARPFRAITRLDIRTWPILSQLLHWNLFRASAGALALEEQYRLHLTGLKLTEMPDRPDFSICATDLAFGVNWTFSKDRCGDYQAGGFQTPPDWTVAKAVAASSCFPPFFNPMSIRPQEKHLSGGKARGCPDWARLAEGITLTDGGVYDNMGLEPVWKRCRTVIVSDGGSPFSFERDRGLFPRLMRYLSVSNNQSRAIRKRWLIASFEQNAMEGTYWGLNSHLADYSDPPRYSAPSGYSDPFVNETIATMRTDLNPFTDAEYAVLENHGYLLAEAGIRRHLPSLVATDANLSLPYSDFTDEATLRRILR